MKAGTFRRDHATSQRFLRIWPSRSSPFEPLQTQPIKTFVNCSQCEPEPLSEQVAVPPPKHNDRNTHTLPLHGMQNKMRRAAKKKTPRRFLLLNRFVRKYSRRKVELQWTRKSERKKLSQNVLCCSSQSLADLADLQIDLRGHRSRFRLRRCGLFSLR